MRRVSWKIWGSVGTVLVGLGPLFVSGCQAPVDVRPETLAYTPGAGVSAAQAALRDKRTAVPGDKPSAIDGERVWKQKCASCHGATGEGDGRTMPDFTSPEYTRDRTPLSTYVAISGDTDPHPFGDPKSAETYLTDQDRWHAAFYVWMLHTTYDSVKRGGATFNVNCSVCHGTRGTGMGQLAHTLQPLPRNFTQFDWMMDKPDNRFFRSIQHGRKWTAMPAWAKLPTSDEGLTEPEIYEIIDYLRTFTYTYPKEIIVEGSGH